MRAFAIILLLPGCAVTIAPDSRCQAPRPVWSVNDTYRTIELQKVAAATWDRNCTLLGAWR